MIKFCSDRLEGLVTSGTKIQMIYICREERPKSIGKKNPTPLILTNI